MALPKLQCEKWTEFQNDILIRLLIMKLPTEIIAEKMNRSIGAISSRIKLLTFNNGRFRKKIKFKL